MKVLIIGGTGTISSYVSRQILEQGHDLYLVNRGNKGSGLFGNPPNLHMITADINNERIVSEAIKDLYFDAVADFIAFNVSDLERDYRVFANKTRQFVYISSASAYRKPMRGPVIDESTPLCNPYWEYSRLKIEGELYLLDKYRAENFPVTIVRPSHTYSEHSIPTALHGENGSWSVVNRVIQGKPVLIPGDGTTFWTCTHSRDFAAGFTGLLGNVQATGETFHIMQDESLTWNQIYESIADAVGGKLVPVHVSSDNLARRGVKYGYDLAGGLLGDKSNSVLFDTSKIKKFVPSFAAREFTRFNAGVREAAEFILQNPEYQKADPNFDKFCDDVAVCYGGYGDASAELSLG